MSHVEVVDHQVSEQSPGMRNIVEGWRERIAAADHGLLKPSDLAVASRPAQRVMARIEAPVEPDLERDARRRENGPACVYT